MIKEGLRPTEEDLPRTELVTRTVQITLNNTTNRAVSVEPKEVPKTKLEESKPHTDVEKRQTDKEVTGTVENPQNTNKETYLIIQVYVTILRNVWMSV